MAAFTTRVELHDKATWNEYERLHVEMERRGFTRTIRGDDGVSYHLPWAEYDYEGNATGAAVIEAAKQASAAAAPTRGRSVLVTEATARIWNGLKAA